MSAVHLSAKACTRFNCHQRTLHTVSQYVTLEYITSTRRLLNGAIQSTLGLESLTMAGAENSALSSERPAQLYVPQHDGLLCYLCRSIRRPEQFGKTLPHRTYLDLKISAARGCALCQFFYKSIGLHQTKSNFSSPLLITPSQSTVSVLDYAATSFDFEIFPIGEGILDVLKESVILMQIF